jgi:hypothetical protein
MSCHLGQAFQKIKDSQETTLTNLAAFPLTVQHPCVKVYRNKNRQLKQVKRP